MVRRACALIAALLVAAPVLADGTVRPADRARLAEVDATFGRAVKQALMEGAPGDVSLLVEALRGAPALLDPEGDWNCRILKLGGQLALNIYADFRCRITATGSMVWQIEKLSGSQRFIGEIRLTGSELQYLGVGFVDGGPAVTYAGLPPDDQTAVWPGQTHAQVGFFEQAGDDRARLILPSPLLESDLNIVYFTR